MPMTTEIQNPNRITIQLLWLTALAGLLQSIIRFVIDEAELIMLETYKVFFITMLFVALFLSILILKYYWHKKYWITFSTATLFAISSIIHSENIHVLITTLRSPPSYISTLIALVGTQFIYSISLIINPTGKRFWLRLAGIFQLIIIIPEALSIYWVSQDPSTQTYQAIAKFYPWLSLASSLSPLLFIQNFRVEALQVKKEPTASLWQTLALLLILLTAGVGWKLGLDALGAVHWAKHNFRETIQLSKTLESRSYVSGQGDTLYYGLLKPLNYDSTKKYPLLINLSQGAQPGKSGGKRQDMGGAAVAKLFLTDAYRKKYPAFIFVPSCPVGSSWGGHPGWRSSERLLYEAIASLDKTEQGIDAKRRYVTGISIAGYGTWNVIAARPDLFAAAIPLCGGGNPKLASKMVNVAVWAFHGEKDINVPVNSSREMIRAIKKAGGHPKYTEFAGQGHNIWGQTMSTPGIWDWLFAQRQN